jgi:DNA-directed RNA polymerase II subunit RPB7
MFFVAHRTRECILHPSYFDSSANNRIKERLYDDMEGKVEGSEMIIQIIEVDDVSDPVLVPGTGMAKYTLSYRAIVWRPFRGEVVDGMVTSVVNTGFFVDVGALTVFVSKQVGDLAALARGVKKHNGADEDCR